MQTPGPIQIMPTERRAASADPVYGRLLELYAERDRVERRGQTSLRYLGEIAFEIEEETRIVARELWNRARKDAVPLPRLAERRSGSVGGHADPGRNAASSGLGEEGAAAST